MENEEQKMPEQGCTNCSGKGCGKCCGGMWRRKQWMRRGRGGCSHGGGLWFVGWLFTIGFLKLAFWKGVLAIIVWPYYLGSFFAR